MNENKTEIVYQIYPMSFCDSNGDGVGDLQGIISKLWYISWMGFTHIWLSPIYKTGFKDNGYDVINYLDIDPVFGKMKDFETLISKAKMMDIKIIMDVVLNHTSVENEWFKKSLKKDKHYKDFYIWRKETNEMESQFEEKTWTYSKERKEYYFHHFSKNQPDINWNNEAVFLEFSNILNFWIKKGVAGFRFDVIDMLGKNVDEGKIINIDNAYKKIRKLGNKSWLNHDLLTVGECWSTSPKDAIKYVEKNNGVFKTLFNGDHMFIGWEKSRWEANILDMKDVQRLKESIFKKQNDYHGKVISSIFIENHDFPRSISRWIKGANNQKKSKVLAVSFFGLIGIPFIFQGQEAGFPNPKFLSINNFNDVETIKFLNNENISNNKKFIMASFGSRDNSRVQMKWDKNYKKSKKWLSNAILGRKVKSIENLIKNKKSSLYTYRFLINLRKRFPTLFLEGTTKGSIDVPKNIFLYKIYNKKTKIIFIANWSKKIFKIDLSGYKKLYGDSSHSKIKAYQTFVGIKKQIK